MSLRWLVTGAGGMVGSDLRAELSARGEEIVSVTRAELDITDAVAVDRVVDAATPDVIVNCAAYTKVDLAETEELAATAINGDGVELLAVAANRANALLVQLSTDFVFDGTSRRPYEAGDPTHPLSAYGRSKLVGERAAAAASKHLVVRTSWLFGTQGPNFVEAIRGQIRKGTDPLRVVDDQRGRPTYTPHLARAIVGLAQAAHGSPDARGIVHYADEDECSWFDFAAAIVAECGANTRLVPVSTAEFPRPAARPAYSVLSTRRYQQITGLQPESWREGLREYLRLRP